MTLRDFGWVLKETGRRSWNDDISGLASQAAFSFAFSLFPALLFLATLLGVLGKSPEFTNLLVEFLGPVLPGKSLNLVVGYLRSLSSANAGSLLSLSLLLTLWAASGVVAAYMKAINRAYEAPRDRPFVRKRGVALGISLLAGVLTLLAFFAMVLGPPVGNLLETYFGLGAIYEKLLEQLRFPFALIGLTAAYALLYRLGPNVKHYWSEVIPGAFLATWLWITVTYGFSVYVTRFGSYDKTYGSLGAVIILLMWMYLTSLAVIVGAEFNAAFGHWLREQRPISSNQ